MRRLGIAVGGLLASLMATGLSGGALVLASGSSVSSARPATMVSIHVDHASASAPMGTALVRAPRALGACHDPAYKLDLGPWRAPFEWSFKSASMPQDLKLAAVVASLKRAANDITSEHNNCGRPDRVSATNRYLGVTKANADACSADLGDSDGLNTVVFGKLPPGTTGLTCLVYSVGADGWEIIEADIVLNKRYARWTTTLDHCNGRFLVEDVAVHEFGHAFGLDHPAPSGHSGLTMAAFGSPCSKSATTLGLGDMLALEKLY